MRRPAIRDSVLVVLAVVVLAVAALSLGGQPKSPLVRALGADEVWLRSIPPSGLCAGGGTVGAVTLHGSLSDPRLAWLTQPDGTTRQLSWRPGTSARFAPSLEVIGPDGRVVAREGSVITGTCILSPDYLLAEFGSTP